MKNRTCCLCVSLFVSCSMPHKSVESRMKVHAADLQQVDTKHKIRLDGVYYVSFHHTTGFSDKKGFYKDSTYEFSFYRFFGNGKVYSSKIFNHKPNQREFKDTFISRDNGAGWKIYFVRENTLYIESYNGYRGYYLDQAIINGNKITLLSEKKTGAENIKVPISTFEFMEFSDNGGQ